jgi:hypothetical protein
MNQSIKKLAQDILEGKVPLRSREEIKQERRLRGEKEWPPGVMILNIDEFLLLDTSTLKKKKAKNE